MPVKFPPVVEDAPAKINLALHVTGKRPDGYHLLESMVLFTRLGDRLTVTPAKADSFEIAGPFADGLTVDTANLVVRARDLFQATYSACPPVSILLQKNLPIASGIGGGSSDAAACLRALARICDVDDDLAELGLELGADVPMCLLARPSIAKGIGEMLVPVLKMPETGMVLINPGVHVSTPAVFKGLASASNPPLPALPDRLDFSSLIEWLRSTRNDLQPAAEAIAPAIGETMTALQRTNAVFARMSGSGATCFGLYERMETAEQAAQAIRAANPGWFVAATSTMS